MVSNELRRAMAGHSLHEVLEAVLEKHGTHAVLDSITEALDMCADVEFDNNDSSFHAYRCAKTAARRLCVFVTDAETLASGSNLQGGFEVLAEAGREDHEAAMVEADHLEYTTPAVLPATVRVVCANTIAVSFDRGVR